MHLVFTVFTNLLTINTFVLILSISEQTVHIFMCLARGVHVHLAILQFVRPELVPNIIFQLTCFVGLSARRLWIDKD